MEPTGIVAFSCLKVEITPTELEVLLVNKGVLKK
jgi:hypothetical protein